MNELDKIKQLKELLDMGAITEEEFEQKKANLLNDSVYDGQNVKPKKQGWKKVVRYIFNFLFVAFFITWAYNDIVDMQNGVINGGRIFYLIGCVIGIPLCIPQLVDRLYYGKITNGEKTKINALKISKALLIVAMLICNNMYAPSLDENGNISNNNEVVIYKNEATDSAKAYFLDNVRLKNEASFTLNDSSVTYNKDMYDSDEYDYVDVNVELDYSAQNGFGGYNRKIAKMTGRFDKLDHSYYAWNITTTGE